MKRKAPIRRKSPNVKRRITGCQVRGCTRRGPFAEVPERRCKFHLKQEADRLWSLAIRTRDGRCMAEGWWGIECRGGLQAMHGMSRRYGATRWLLSNGLSGCAAHHEKMTHSHAHHEEFWTDIAYEDGRVDHYDNLRQVALYYGPMDPAEVIRALREEA
jgi:hypothetical protein